MSQQSIGTCGNCGGMVAVPTAWYGIYPPTPTCVRCGAVPKNTYGPRMEMDPPRESLGPKGNFTND